MENATRSDRDETRTAAPRSERSEERAELLPLDVPQGEEVPFHVPRD